MHSNSTVMDSAASLIIMSTQPLKLHDPLLQHHALSQYKWSPGKGLCILSANLALELLTVWSTAVLYNNMHNYAVIITVPSIV